MKFKIDREMLFLIGGVVGFLLLATFIGQLMKGRADNEGARNTINNLNARIRAWWSMVAVFGLAMVTGGIGSIVLFGLTSFWALREFITLTPTRQGDHRALFWAFFI